MLHSDIVLDWHEHRLHMGGGMLLMGVINVTPDSFSDGGDFADTEAAIEHGRRLVEAGANLLDIGGASSRPGAEEIDEDEELERIIPVIETLSEEIEIPISVDSYRPEVIREALAAGASIINDITGLHGDPEVAEIAAKSHVPVIAMHMQGTPATMQDNPSYDDVVAEVVEYLKESVEIAVDAGLPQEFVILDPGIGFGKTLEHNHALLTNIKAFLDIGQPLLVGPSRKGFLGHILGKDTPKDRDHGTAAVASYLSEAGVHICRVHNVGLCIDPPAEHPDFEKVLAWLEGGNKA